MLQVSHVDFPAPAILRAESCFLTFWGHGPYDAQQTLGHGPYKGGHMLTSLLWKNTTKRMVERS